MALGHFKLINQLIGHLKEIKRSWLGCYKPDLCNIICYMTYYIYVKINMQFYLNSNHDKISHD